jgi:hypothetical protein
MEQEETASPVYLTSKSPISGPKFLIIRVFGVRRAMICCARHDKEKKVAKGRAGAAFGEENKCALTTNYSSIDIS